MNVRLGLSAKSCLESLHFLETDDVAKSTGIKVIYFYLDFNRQPILQPNNIINSILFQYTAVEIQHIFRDLMKCIAKLELFSVLLKILGTIHNPDKPIVAQRRSRFVGGTKKEFEKWRFWELDLPWRRIFTKED